MRVKQAVILAAGMSTRTYPLTLNRPKALLKILNLENIFYLLNGLNNAHFEKVVLVVHFKKDLLMNLIGERFKNLKIAYAFQEQPLGTGHAVLCAKDYLNKEPFLVLNSDDFILPSVFAQEIEHIPSLLISHHEQAYRFGVVELNGNKITKIIEKDPNAKPFSPVNTGAWFLPYEALNWLKEIKPAEDGEIRLTDIIPYLLQLEVFAFDIQDNWIPMTYPWDWLLINQKLLNNCCFQNNKFLRFFNHLNDTKQNEFIKSGNSNKIQNSIIGKNCLIREGALIINSIIGRNCQILKNSQIINSIIDDNVIIKEGSLIKNSIVMENTIIGKDVKTIISNYENNIMSLIKGKLIDTGLKELGGMIAEDVVIEDEVILMPGVKIWPHRIIPQNSIIDTDAMDQ